MLLVVPTAAIVQVILAMVLVIVSAVLVLVISELQWWHSHCHLQEDSLILTSCGKIRLSSSK